jgi:glutaredoxin-related protein
MIVEFIGPPAAGKSTVEATLAPLLDVEDSNRWAKHDQSKMFTEAVRGSITQPRDSATLFHHLIRTEQDKIWYYPYLWAYGTALFQYISRRRPDVPCLLDQGPIQYIWGVGMSGEYCSQLIEFVLDSIRSLDHDYMIVNVEVSREELKRRLEAREDRKRMETFYNEKFDQGIELSQDLATLCQNEEAIQYVEIDGESLPESSAVEIQTALATK